MRRFGLACTTAVLTLQLAAPPYVFAQPGAITGPSGGEVGVPAPANNIPTFGGEAVRPTRHRENRGNIPPPLAPTRAVGDSFQCQRYLQIDGKKYPCDSLIRQDAEGLRNIVKDVPPAVAEIDEYQHNRRIVRNAAYIGTLGILVFGLGAIIGSQLPGTSQKVVTATTSLAGLSITGGAILYGLSLTRANEAHLARAVEAYNQARPSKPIELIFNTTITF